MTFQEVESWNNDSVSLNVYTLCISDSISDVWDSLLFTKEDTVKIAVFTLLRQKSRDFINDWVRNIKHLYSLISQSSVSPLALKTKICK